MPWKNDTFLKSDPQLCRNGSDMVHEAGFTADLPVYIAWMDAKQKNTHQPPHVHDHDVVWFGSRNRIVEVKEWPTVHAKIMISQPAYPRNQKMWRREGTIRHDGSPLFITLLRPNIRMFSPGVLTTPWLTRWYPGDLRFPGERSGCRGTSL